MREIVRAWIPPLLIDGYRQFRRMRERKRNHALSTEEVFTSIYAQNKWGGSNGEFCSGLGTTDDAIVQAYVSMVADRGASDGFLAKTFVDLGCGDFRVGKLLLPYCDRYIGVDIVKALIQRNRSVNADAKATFAHLDLVRADLPDGDVCFVRQVLQHLSNDQILAILGKLEKYSWVFITEHYPSDNRAIRANLDKPHGGDVRVHDNSGVYLTLPPFQLPAERVEQVLEVPGSDMGPGQDRGVIRTFLYRPQA